MIPASRVKNLYRVYAGVRARPVRNHYFVKHKTPEVLRFIGYILLITLVLSSCVNTKYAYQLEIGKSVDFSSGRWILNKPYTDGEIPHLEDIALKEFRSILHDSLFEIDDLRGKYLIVSKPSYDLSVEDLNNLKIGTDADFIINYKVDVLNDRLNSLSGAPLTGTTIRINEVMVEIAMFDITNAKLLSRTSIVGKAELEMSSDDSEWKLADSPNVISRKALSKLIKQYKRNKK